MRKTQPAPADDKVAKACAAGLGWAPPPQPADALLDYLSVRVQCLEDELASTQAQLQASQRQLREARQLIAELVERAHALALLPAQPAV